MPGLWVDPTTPGMAPPGLFFTRSAFAIYLTAGLSVFAHGLTAAPLANRYEKWFERHPGDRAPANGELPRPR